MIPLSLYIHFPWCVKKCPYCDFNSHALNHNLPEQEYVAALIQDFTQDLPLIQNRKIQSIFLGGGTPSLFSAHSLEQLLNTIQKLAALDPDVEITMETNPGTVEHHAMQDYQHAGVNRISVGVQSFDDEKLVSLGRIHKAAESLQLIEKLHQANFKTFNLDLMHGLPKQTVEQAIADLQTAINMQAPHISWYQLTLEPNTIFYKYPPALPAEDITWQIQTQGEQLLSESSFQHYEVSAFTQAGQEARHNLNYWNFGDYLGIGAGAHAKITALDTFAISRTWKTRSPKDYLDPNKKFLAGTKTIARHELPAEFMLNRLRLFKQVTFAQFQQCTNLPPSAILGTLQQAQSKGLLQLGLDSFALTDLGKRFLNDLLQLFIQA